jgi:hypothetical protein
LEPGGGPCGEVNSGGAAAWRFTVQQADTDATRHSFTSLDDVTAYLETELAATAALASAQVKTEDDFPDHARLSEEAP